MSLFKKKQKILIVDDSKAIRKMLSLKFKAEGFDVAEAEDGIKGLEKAKSEKPALIMLDVQMPNMNGVEMLSRLKADPETSRVRVIFLTNYGETDADTSWLDTKFAKDAGAVEFIKKTDDVNAIYNKVRQVLADTAPSVE